MKRFYSFVFLLIAGILAVSCYDDSSLWKSVNDHESRLVKLETLCKEMNTNISSLQAIVNASQSGDYIKDVSPVMEGGEEVGYIITFANAGKITIWHGKDGKDGQDGAPGKDGADTGSVPKIGIKAGEDGVYYWSLNGEWLTDDAGNRIKAVGSDGRDGTDGKDGVDGTDGSNGSDGKDGVNGTDGKDGVDGVTPQLKIEDDYWYVSYDNGKTWERLEKAVGEDGKDGVSGGDSIFSEVYQQGGYVHFILSNGDSYKVPTSAAASVLDVEFDVEQGVAIIPGTTLKVKYTVTGAEGDVLVRSIVTLDDEMAVVKQIDNSTGYIYIHLWDDYFDEDDRDEILDEEIFGDTTYEEFMNNLFCVLVVVTDSKGNQIVKALNYVEGVLESVNDAYLTDAVAGTVTAVMKTNVTEGSYEVSIPEKAQSWLSYVPTKAQMREKVLNFSVKANDGDKFRSANVSLVNSLGQVLESFTVVQRSSIAGKIMTFADPRVKAVCVGRFDKNLDGELTYEEVATVTDVKNLFLLEKNIVSFDEFEFFSSVTEIPDEFFMNCKKLESVKLPESVASIGDHAFDNCVSLRSITIPESVVNNGRQHYEYEYGYRWFAGCSSLESVTLPSTLKHLPSSCFEDCVSLKSITIPEGIDAIPNLCFKGCSALSTFDHKSPIVRVSSEAFFGCRSLKSFDFSSLCSVNLYDNSSLGMEAFKLSGLTSVVIPETVTSIKNGVFCGCEDLVSVTLHDKLTHIHEGAFGDAEYFDYDKSKEYYAGCTSLKNIVLPESLEYIGLGAFAGSAIEGQEMEGTSVKALVIPAKVTYLGSGAFGRCSSLSAVKMLPVYPPEGGWSFDDGTTVYVHPDAVDAYRESAFGDYTILPYDMMSVSLGLEFEIAGGPSSYEGNFRFPVSAKVTGDLSKMDNVMEYGYFMKPADDRYYGEEITYYPVSSLDSLVLDIIHVYRDGFDLNYDSYVASAVYQAGAYVRLVDGTIVTYDKRSVELVYDVKPEIKLGEIVAVGNGAYRLPVVLSGNIWIDDLEIDAHGEFSWQSDGSWRQDGLIYLDLYLSSEVLWTSGELTIHAVPCASASVSYDFRHDLYLIGSFNGWNNDDNPYKMTFEDDWYVYRGFTANEEVEMKMNCGWWGFEVTTWDDFEINAPMWAERGGENIRVPAGTYDIYVSADGSLLYFMTPGLRP